MASTLSLSLTVAAKDIARKAASFGLTVVDPAPTPHDYIDPTQVNLATLGAVGAAFVVLPTPDVQVERITADLLAGTDMVLRSNGAAAFVLGSVTTVAPVGGETLVLDVDGSGSLTTTLQSSDNTIALVAKRINYAMGSTVASVDATGVLRLSGAKSGDAAAQLNGYQFGYVNVVSGTGLALLGLTAAKTYATGDDLRVGPGPLALTYSPNKLPKRIELSGLAPNAQFVLAGKAS